MEIRQFRRRRPPALVALAELDLALVDCRARQRTIRLDVERLRRALTRLRAQAERAVSAGAVLTRDLGRLRATLARRDGTTGSIARLRPSLDADAPD